MRCQFTRRHLFRLATITVATLTLAVTAAIAVINRGPVPTMLAHKAIALLEQHAPVQIEMASAKFTGPLSLVLDDIAVSVTSDVGLAAPLRARQIRLQFSLLSMLRGTPWAGLEQVHIVEPQVTVEYERYLEWVQFAAAKTEARPAQQAKAAARPQAAQKAVARAKSEQPWLRLALYVRQGRLALAGDGAPGPVTVDAAVFSSEQEINVTRLQLQHGAGKAVLAGRVGVDGTVVANGELSDWLLTDLLTWYPSWQIHGRGTVAANLRLEGTLSKPQLKGQIRLADAGLVWPGQNQPLPVTSAAVDFSTDGGGITVDELAISTSTGQVTAQGSVNSGKLNLQVAARNLSLPNDIPWLSAWGISGRAQFTGTVTGALLDPQLAGHMRMQKGTLWRQAIDAAEGELQLSRNRFQFSQVEIDSGAARYRLQGSLSRLDQAGREELLVRLDSQQGRVEQLLAVLDLPDIARGQLDGTLTFAGPFTSVVTSGDARVSQARVYGEPLDGVEGSFRWGDGRLQLDAVNAKLGRGTLVVDGEAALDGQDLQLEIDARNWPLEQVQYLQAMVPGWRGDISWHGTLKGTVTNPQLQGELAAADLSIGPVVLESVTGPVELEEGDLATTGLLAQTAEGGQWWLTGKVANILTQPELAVSVRVEGESLSSLLAMGGYRVPATLVDGAVQGEIALSGPATKPEARLHLSLAERGLDDLAALRVDMLIADKRVRILRAGA